MATEDELRAAGDEIERLLAELRANANPRTCAQAEELLRLVVELYASGLEHIMGLAAQLSPPMVRAMADDELVASLLVAHGLHPDGLDLVDVRPASGDAPPWVSVELRSRPVERAAPA